jgi:hypothetical protein
MQLSQLAVKVPETMLTGVDRFQTQYEAWAGEMEPCQSLRFRLQGKAGPYVFMCIEDPQDGYRSSMREMVVMKDHDVDPPVKNTFTPVKVRLKHLTTSEESGDTRDILEIRRADNDALVIQVGTENTSDYYPYFRDYFDAEALGTVAVAPINNVVKEEPKHEEPEGWGAW